MAQSEYQKQYYMTNKNRITQRAIEWQRDNKETHNKHVAEYARRNPDVARQASQKYITKNKGTLPYAHRCILTRAKARAKSYGLDFNLTIEYIQSIWPADNKCPVFGLEFDLHGQDLQRCASIDKIVPSRGYVQGNVSIVSFRANSIKRDSTFEELKLLLEYMKRHQVLQE